MLDTFQPSAVFTTTWFIRKRVDPPIGGLIDEFPEHSVRMGVGIGSTALSSPTDYGPWESASKPIAPGSPWKNGFAERLDGIDESSRVR